MVPQNEASTGQSQVHRSTSDYVTPCTFGFRRSVGNSKFDENGHVNEANYIWTGSDSVRGIFSPESSSRLTDSGASHTRNLTRGSST